MRLADPEAGRVEQLEQRPIPEGVGGIRRVGGLGIVAAGGLEQAHGLVGSQGLGQEAGWLRQVQVRGHVDGDQSLAVGEPVEALEGGRPASQAAGREPGIAPSAATGPCREVADGRIRGSGPGPAHAAGRLVVVQVAAIGADGRWGQATFDPQVGQVVVDRGVEGAHQAVVGSAGLGDLAAPGLGAVEELPGAGERRRTARVAAEHLRQLDDPAFPVQAFDLGHGPTVALSLGDAVLGVGVSGDLWQMRHAQDLMPPGERPQAASDGVRAPAADARVDLVEHEDGRVIRFGQHALDGQRHARQLAARGDPRERPGGLAGVRGETVDDLVGAAGIERDRIAVELDRGLVRSGDPTPERDLEDIGRKPELLEDESDRTLERVAGGASRLRQGHRRGRHALEQDRVLALAAGAFRVETAESLQLLGRPSRRGR